MKKFIQIIVSIIILTSSFCYLNKNIYAETVLTKDIYGIPYSITLNTTLSEISVNFDIASLEKNIDIQTASIMFNQEEDLSGNSLLKALDTQTEDILSVASASTSGEKTLSGLARFIDIEEDSSVITFTIKVDNIDKDLTLSNITLHLEYSIVDNVSPVVQNIEILEATNDTAQISWETNEQTNSSVWYGKTSNYNKSINSDNSTLIEGSNPPIYKYSVLIMNLSPGITYHFQVVSEDAAGNVTKSEDKTFLTKLDISDMQVLGEDDTEGLQKIEDITGELFYENGVYTFEISWQKSEDSNIDGYILYRKQDDQEMVRYKQIESDKDKYSDLDITEGSSYTYFIRSLRDEMVSPKSDQLQIKVIQENVSSKTSTQKDQIIDVAKILAFVAALTMFTLVCGYFLTKKLGKFFKEIFTMEKRKNLFRDPKFIQEEFEKSNKNKL